jgi:catechol 2,3-dioxygenase-like lactoylglutathione lyase family enzyme
MEDGPESTLNAAAGPASVSVPKNDLMQTRPLEIGIVVGELERQITFYREGLGCTEVRRVDLPSAVTKPSGLGSSVTLVLMLTPGGEGIKLISPHGGDSPPQARPDDLTSSRGVAYLTFGVADLDPAVRRLLAAGATLRSAVPRVRTGPDTAIVFLDDPEGNTIELVERATPPGSGPTSQD